MSAALNDEITPKPLLANISIIILNLYSAQIRAGPSHRRILPYPLDWFHGLSDYLTFYFIFLQLILFGVLD